MSPWSAQRHLRRLFLITITSLLPTAIISSCNQPGSDCIGSQLGIYLSPTRQSIPCSSTSTPGYTCTDDGTLRLCQSGYYCPDSATKMICPSGYFCPQGSSSPRECQPGSLCAEKTFRQNWYLLLLSFLFTFATLIIAYRLRRRNQRRKVYLNPFEMMEDDSPTTQKKQQQSTRIDVAADQAATAASDALQRVQGMQPTTKLHMERVCVQVRDRNEQHSQQEQQQATQQTWNDPAGNNSSSAATPSSSSTKTILHNITSSITGGRLTAIMGPSGSGKTTLLNALFGRVSLSSGNISINYQYTPADIAERRLIAFVPQDDTMLHMMTVNDLLTHAAYTRLPATLTTLEKRLRVIHTMALLGLTHLADVRVGNDLERGISGGERKRVSIAMELVADPLMLMLDEPTSGLDSSAALTVCTALHRIASRRTLVACVIHQPRYEVFTQFDDLILLGKGGHLVYSGPVTGVKSFFDRLGYPTPQNTNPADHIIDVISSEGWIEKWVQGGEEGVKRKKKGLGGQDLDWHEKVREQQQQEKQQQEKQLNDTEKQELELKTAADTTPPPATTLITRRQSATTPLPVVHVTTIITSPKSLGSKSRRITFTRPTPIVSTGLLLSPSNVTLPEPPSPTPSDVAEKRPMLLSASDSHAPLSHRIPATFLLQLYYTLKRCFLQDLRYPKFVLIDTFLQCLPGIALAVPSLGIDIYTPPLPLEIAQTCFSMIRGRCLAAILQPKSFIQTSFFMTMILGAAGQVFSVQTFGKYSAVYRREASTGSIDRRAYFIGKCLYDLIHITRSAVIFTSFFFFLNPPIGSYGLWFLLIWLLIFTSYGIGYLVSLLISFHLATTISVCTAICFSVTSGLSPSLNSVNGWGVLKFIWWCSYNRWAAEGIVILSFIGIETNGRMEQAIAAAGYDAGNLALDLAMLAIIGIVWRMIAALVLWRKHK